MTWMLVLTDENIDPDKQQQLISGALPIAGLFVLVLGIALFFLWRSMNKQMGRIDPNLPPGRDASEQALDRELTQEAVARGEAQEQAATSDPEEPTPPPSASGT